MAASKPVIHGRDHLPGGADPIPGLHTLLTDATFVPNHAEGRYQIVSPGSVTVTSGGATTIDWDYISGDALLDISTPSAPTPMVNGWYTVDVTWASVSTGWTIGATHQAHLEFHGAQFKHAWNTVVIGAHDLPNGGDLADTRQGFVSLSGYLRAGTDYIALILENLDSASRDLTADTIEVSRVYAYPT